MRINTDLTRIKPEGRSKCEYCKALFSRSSSARKQWKIGLCSQGAATSIVGYHCQCMSKIISEFSTLTTDLDSLVTHEWSAMQFFVNRKDHYLRDSYTFYRSSHPVSLNTIPAPFENTAIYKTKNPEPKELVRLQQMALVAIIFRA